MNNSFVWSLFTGDIGDTSLGAHSCRGDRAREGKAWDIFPTLATSSATSLATSDQIAPLGKANPIWVQESRVSDRVRCASVSSVQFGVHVSACCLICTVGTDYASLAPPRAIWEVSSEQSFKHVHRPYQLPTCRPACAVTSLFGCESLRSTPLETCLSVLQVHYLDYRRVSELHYLGTSGPCLYCWNLRQGWNYPFTSYCPECSDCSTMSLIGICSTYPLFYCLCCLKCAHCTLCSSHTYVTVIVHWWLAHCLDFAV